MSRPTTTDDLVRRLQDPVTDHKERVALQALATEMIKLFGEKKSPHLGHEAAALALVATSESYKDLLWAFDNAITKGTADGNILHPHLCKGFVHVLRSSIPRDPVGNTKIDMRLGTVLGSLKTRLESAVAQADPYAEYQLVSTLGSVLHAMYDVQTTGIDRETLQKPLLDKLDRLSKDKEIRLAQAATYAHEALRCIPDSDGPYKILLQNLVNVVGAASKIAGAVATMDASKLFDGVVALADVPDLVSSMVEVVESISVAVDNLEAMKETVSRQRKPRSWYVALRYSDMLIQNMAFTSLKDFIEKVPCRQDIDFLCGIFAQLEQAWVAAATDDRAQTLAIQGQVQDVFESLPEPKSISDPLHGVFGGRSGNCKHLDVWKDAISTTFGEPLQVGRKQKDYTYSIGCYTVTSAPLPTELLSKAWLKCTKAQLFYADASLRKHYLARGEHLLHIQRLSDDRLLMKHCYVNLDIIKASETTQETVPLQSLFNPRTCADGETRVPRRLLIRGAAGVGKTTLCKKIVYEFTRSPTNPDFQSWTTLYDRVIWFPLRNLQLHNPGTNYRLMDLFRAEYLSLLPDSEIFAKVLEDNCSKPSTEGNTNHRKSSRTLFLLDGLDEMSQQLDSEHQAAKFLTQLLNQPDVIITSRPGASLPNQLKPLDCELETTGFNNDQVRQYVHYSLRDTQQADALLRFLHSHKLLSGLVKIPVQLDALCYIWQDNPDDHNTASKSIKTSTSVYRAIEHKLWRKDIPRLKKRDSRGGLITEAKARVLRTDEQIRQLVNVEIGFLQFLAFSGLVSEAVYFDESHCDNVQRHMDSPQLTGFVDDVLLNLSCLRTLEASTSAAPDPMAAKDLHRTYHFIHSTYQEYFAAQYFVSRWTTDKELAFFSSDEKQVVGTDKFIADHKYDSRYSVFWRFVAGLLHNGKDAPDTTYLERFFDALDNDPRDILGMEHQKLVVQCLVEADPTQDMAIFNSHRSLLQNWVAYEFDRWTTVRLLELFSFPERIYGPILQGQKAEQFPALLDQIQNILPQDVPPDLCIIDASGEMPASTYRILLKQPFLSLNVLQAISEHLHRSPIGRHHRVFYILGQHLGDALSCLLNCLNHSTGFVRANAAIAFAEIVRDEVALPPKAVTELVLHVNDVFENAAFNAIVALCNVWPFPQQAIDVICARLRNEDDNIRKIAAKAVGQARTLPVEVLLEITEQLLDPALEVRSAATRVFHKIHGALPNSVVARLAQFLGSSSEVETSATIDALDTFSATARTIPNITAEMHMRDFEESNLSDQVLEKLITLLHNAPNPKIRAVAALTLRKSAGRLPPGIYNELAAGLDDPEIAVRSYTALALTHHLTPHVPTVDDIFLSILSRVDDIDNKVKWHVFDSLPKELPLSPTTMHILAHKVWDSTTPSIIRTWILQMFELQADRLPESTIYTLATLQQKAVDEFQQRAVDWSRTPAPPPLGDPSPRQIDDIFRSRHSLPEDILSNLIRQLSGDGGFIGPWPISSIAALSQRDLLSQPVLSGILSCLTDTMCSKAEEVLYRKTTLPLDILEPLLQYTVRTNDIRNSDKLWGRIIRHIIDRPDTELCSLLKSDSGNARLLFECCFSMTQVEPVLCYADGGTHYAFVVGGLKRRVPKSYFFINPEEILRELGVPVGLPRVSEEKTEEESEQESEGDDGEKGVEKGGDRYRSAHVFVIFVILFIWAVFFFSN